MTDDLGSNTDLDDNLAGDLAAAFASAASDTSDASGGSSLGSAGETAPALDTQASTEPAVATETAEQAAQRARDERGRFAPKAELAPKPAGTETAEGTAPQATPESAPVVEGAVPGAPPPGWDIAAKTEYANLPASVKAAIAKRETEVNNGLSQLREYRDLKPYNDLARSRNVTLPQMMERFVKADEALTKNTIPTLFWLAQNYGISPQQLAQVAMGQASPQQAQQQPQQAQPQQRQQPAIDPRQIFEMARQAAREEHTHREVATTLNQFLSNPKYPYAQNLRPQMARLIENGDAATLEEAYETACWAHPQIRPLLIKQQAPAPAPAPAPAVNAAQAASNARAAAKSVTGSPVPGASSAPNANSELSIADSLRASFRAQRV